MRQQTERWRDSEGSLTQAGEDEIRRRIHINPHGENSGKCNLSISYPEFTTSYGEISGLRNELLQKCKDAHGCSACSLMVENAGDYVPMIRQSASLLDESTV